MEIREKLLCLHTRIKPLENLSSVYQILCSVHCLSIERPPAPEMSNTRIYFKQTLTVTCFAVIDCSYFFPPKIPAVVLDFFAGKRQRVKQLSDARETFCKIASKRVLQRMS